MQRKLLGIISADFDTKRQLLVIYSACQILQKKWEYNEVVHQLLIDLKKKTMIQLGGRSLIFLLSLVSL